MLKNKKFPIFFLVILLSLLFIVTVSIAQVEDDMFALDQRYEDRDGDMVADPPENEDEWLDPEVLVFTYAPVEDPAVYREVFEEFVSHLEQELGRTVQYFNVKSYAAQIEAMRAGRLHISGFSSGSVPDAVSTAGFRPMVVMGDENGMISYRMAVITHQESDIYSVEDLKGKEIALVSETSGSGYFTPRALFYEEFGMLSGIDYEVTFSGSHDNSILGVYHGDYIAAPIANTVLDRMYEGGRLENPDNWVRIIFESPPLPVTAYGTAHNLHPDLQEKVKQAFLSFDWEGTRLAEQWEGHDRFVEIDYKRDWEITRTIRRGSEAVAELLGE